MIALLIIPLLIPAAVGIVVVVTIAAVAGVVLSGDVHYPNMPQNKRDKFAPDRWENRQQIWDLASKLAKELNWPDLPAFMITQAYRESRYKLTARNPEPGQNAARGVFQIRPSSGFVESFFGPLSEIDPEELYDLPLSVALDAWYLHRLRKWAPSGTITWAGLRRGTALPKLVKDNDLEKPRSRDTQERFLSDLNAVGFPESFADQLAFQNNYKWPGIERVMEIVGVDPGDWKA